MSVPISLLVVDIDGCLVAIEHAPYRLERLAEVARFNRLSLSDPRVPPLTILSGRPHPYVDALMQILDIRLPAIFENGAGLAWRDPYVVQYRDEAEAGRESLEALARELRGRDDLFIQPGKTASLTVFPLSGRERGGIEAELRELVDRLSLDLIVDPAGECVNLLVPGVDKGLGLRWLAKEVGVRLEAVAGMGDSIGDLAWLPLCGLSAAPRNAVERVRRAVDEPLDGDDIDALIGLYERAIALNAGEASRQTD